MSAPTYTIRTVADFLLVPPERLGACLAEFRLMLDTARGAIGALDAIAGERFGEDAVRFCLVDKFEWVDDDKGEIRVKVTVPYTAEDAQP